MSTPSTHRVFELRQYTTLPGRRDALIDHFERHFVVPQDAVGAQVLGRFRDLDDPERFVWMRGFPSMAARFEALTAFYDGPVWKAQRDGAVATMRETDNVLLLRPSSDGEGLASGTAGDPSLLLVLVHALRTVHPDAFARHYAAHCFPVLVAAGATDPRALVTETATNDFARHPVRVGESVLACFARFADRARLDAWLGDLDRWARLRAHAPDALLPAFMSKPEVLRLEPTARSARR